MVFYLGFVSYMLCISYTKQAIHMSIMLNNKGPSSEAFPTHFQLTQALL